MAYKRASAMPVVEGGTGAQTFTAYSVICAGTTATGAMQNVVGLGVANQVLVSNGAAALPSWQAIPATAGVTSITGNLGGGAQTGAITLSGGTTGAGFTGAAGTVTMSFAGITANGGTVSLATDASNTTVNIATGAGNKVTTLGSTSGSSSLALKYGTNDFTLASATGTTMAITHGGSMTKPLQPAFRAYLSANVNNVTGDGTVYTLICNTVLFDQQSNYNNSTGIFTAPVTGKYSFNCTAWFQGMASNNNMAYIEIEASSDSSLIAVFNPYATIGVGQGACFSGICILSMTAADTVHAALVCSGGSKVIGFSSGADRTSFAGCLLL